MSTFAKFIVAAMFATAAGCGGMVDPSSEQASEEALLTKTIWTCTASCSNGNGYTEVEYSSCELTSTGAKDDANAACKAAGILWGGMGLAKADNTTCKNSGNACGGSGSGTSGSGTSGSGTSTGSGT